MTSEEFRASVSLLAKKLRVCEHPSDPVVTLHACCQLIERTSGKGNNESKQKGTRSVVSVEMLLENGDSYSGEKYQHVSSFMHSQVQRVNLDDHDMGVPDKLKTDKGLYQALKVLRLLHIQVITY